MARVTGLWQVRKGVGRGLGGSGGGGEGWGPGVGGRGRGDEAQKGWETRAAGFL